MSYCGSSYGYFGQAVKLFYSKANVKIRQNNKDIFIFMFFKNNKLILEGGAIAPGKNCFLHIETSRWICTGFYVMGI